MYDNNDLGVDSSGGDRVERLEGRQRISPALVGFVVIAVVTAIFVIQNGTKQKVRFLFFSVEARTWVAIAVAIALGVVLDRMFSRWWRHRRQR
jgi:uncharacterized integral membrane protein